MNKHSTRIILAGFLTVFVSFTIRYCYGMLLQEMLREFSMSKTEAGVIFASYFVAYTVCSPVMGFFADKFSIRAILPLFVAVLGLGTLLMSRANSVLDASLFFTIAGIGHSACWVSIVTLVQRWVKASRRGTALALVDLGSAVGIGTWSFLLPQIVSSYDWRVGWISLGLVAFLIALMDLLLVRNHPAVESSIETLDSETSAMKRTYGSLLKDRNLWFIGLSYLLLGFCVLIPFTFLTIYATQQLNIPYELSTRLIAVIAVSGVFGKLVLAPLSDVLGRIRVMMLCGALIAAASLGMAYSREFGGLILFTITFGCGYGAIWPIYAASASDFFPGNVTGSVIGLWTLFLGAGSIVAPVVSGWSIDITASYVSAFLIATGSAILSILFLVPMLLRRRSKSQ